MGNGGGVHAGWKSLEAEEDVRLPAVGVRGSCEPLSMGAGNQSWVL